MKVILLEDIKGLGKKNDIVNANDGYVRNFLFPKKLAIVADNDNLNKLQQTKAKESKIKNIELEAIREKIQKLKNKNLLIKVKAGENGKIFGSVTTKEITEEILKQYQIEIEKKNIILKDAIKSLGSFKVQIKFKEKLETNINVNVESE